MTTYPLAQFQEELEWRMEEAGAETKVEYVEVAGGMLGAGPEELVPG